MAQSVRSKRIGSLLIALAMAALVVSVLLARCERKAPEESASPAGSGAPVGRVLMGHATFEAKCAFCHYVDREETKIGPGLKGLLSRASLPASGRPATAENVLSQLWSPVGKMPSFKSLSGQEVADLLAYLKTL